MSTQVVRPIFSENQILSAADVNGIVTHARGARERHNRFLHSWGIAFGLELTTQDRQDTSGKFVEVSVQPGIAIDGTGREIVVTEAFRLSEDLFDQLNVAENITDPDNPPKYPVFILGRDQRQQPSAMSRSACFRNEPSRTAEGYEITFGRVGDAAQLDEQPLPELGQDGTSSIGAWKILLGFVQWNGTHFTAENDEADGIARRYVGVNAEDVTSPSGRLTLRSSDRHQSDRAALVIDNTNDGEMRFGLQDDNGTIVPVFTVNAKGDVTAEGKIMGAIAGGVQIESGVISDGLLVPLPAGITQDLIDSGQASIHVQLTPRVEIPTFLPPAGGNIWVMHPLECFADDRQVNCKVLWQEIIPGTNGVPLGSLPQVLPGACDYQVFGLVKKKDDMPAAAAQAHA
jgi:hypothetical protein